MMSPSTQPVTTSLYCLLKLQYGISEGIDREPPAPQPRYEPIQCLLGVQHNCWVNISTRVSSVAIARVPAVTSLTCGHTHICPRQLPVYIRLIIH